MRYTVKYIGRGRHAVIDTKAPASVLANQKHGHALLITRNGSEPVEVAARALNSLEHSPCTDVESHGRMKAGRAKFCQTCGVKL